jgi:hypothetical protein
MPRTKPAEVWRDWTAEDSARQPRRVCSVAGCKEKPRHVKETRASARPDGKPTLRRHVYCDVHAPAQSSV